MAYYNTCPECGATLDPGEQCSCQERKRKEVALQEIIGTTSDLDLENKPTVILSQNTKSVKEVKK